MQTKEIEFKRVLKVAGLVVLLLGAVAEVVLAYRLSAGSPFGKDGMTTMAVVVFPLLVTAAIIAYFCLVKTSLYEKLGLPKIYLMSALLIGLAFTILMPVGVVPDEPQHARGAYYVSNVMMGKGKGENGSILMRRDDADTRFIDTNWKHKYAAEYYEHLFDPVSDTEMVETDAYPADKAQYIYFVPAVGITIGRLCHLGMRGIYFLGRIFAVVAFVLTIYYAMKLLPFGQILVFVWAMIPMTSQQTYSLSYDNPVNALSVLIIALTLNLLYGEQDSEKQKKIRIGILIAACLLLIPVKHGAMFPIAMIPLVFVWKWYKNRRESFSKKTKMIIRVALIALAILFLVGVVAYIVISLRPEKVNGGWVSWAHEPGYTIGYLLLHPGTFLKLLYNTALDGDYYILTLFGNHLSWWTKGMPIFLTGPFAIFLAIGAFRREDEEQLIPMAMKWWVWILCIFVAMFSFAGMLLRWTPLSYDHIEGVQGRYFLPLVVPVMLMCRTKRACVGRNTERVLAMFSVLLQMPIVLYLYMQVV